MTKPPLRSLTAPSQMGRDGWGENRQNLVYIILVELLAYPFASPVRWIQTQDLLFIHFDFERLQR